MAELLIGRYGQANAVTSMQKIARNTWQKRFGFVVGFGGIICAALILSFLWHYRWLDDFLCYRALGKVRWFE